MKKTVLVLSLKSKWLFIFYITCFALSILSFMYFVDCDTGNFKCYKLLCFQPSLPRAVHKYRYDSGDGLDDDDGDNTMACAFLNELL